MASPTQLARVVAAALIAVTTVALAGCASPEDTRSVEETTDTLLGHVHGLGTDPETGALYAAAHHGVFTFTEGTPQRVADRWQDTMAFTVIGPGHLLASGHPDLREEGPIHLGLIESTDGAETWRSLSLAGEADFHALDAADSRIYGYDSLTNTLLTSEHGLDWEQVASLPPVVDLAVDPGNSDRLLLTRPDATLHRYLRTGESTEVRGAPPLAYVDWADLDVLAGLGPDATVYTSLDDGESWVRTGAVPGEPEALDATDDTWYAATTTGIYLSTDAGRTWEVHTAR